MDWGCRDWGCGEWGVGSGCTGAERGCREGGAQVCVGVVRAKPPGGEHVLETVVCEAAHSPAPSKLWSCCHGARNPGKGTCLGG